MSISALNTELFIQEMMERPAIWQSRHRHHRYKNIIKKLWKELHMRFPDFSVEDLKKKWKNLKDTYRKELKKCPQDSSGLYQSQWIHFSALEFLRSECQGITVEDTTNEEDYNMDDLSSNSEIGTQDNEVHVTTNTLPSVATASYSTHSLLLSKNENTNKRKLNNELAEHLEIEKKKLKILEEEVRRKESEKSDNYYFLMSILPEMDKLNPIQKFRLRNNINKSLMDEIELAMYGDPLTTTTKQELVEKEENY